MNEQRTERKREALAEIARIAQKNHITLEDIRKVFPGVERRAHAASYAASVETGSAITATHVFYYLGALFLFSGMLSYYVVYRQMFSVAKSSLLFLSMGSIAFLMAAILLKNLPSTHRAWREKKLIYVLLFVAVLGQSVGLYFSFDEFTVILREETVSALVYLILAGSVGVALLSIPREPLLSLGLCYITLFWFFVFQRLRIPEELSYLILGLCLCLLAYYAIAQSKQVFSKLWYFIGSVMLQCGTFNLVIGRPVSLLFPALTLALLYAGIRLHQKVLFISGTLGLLVYINVMLYRYLAKSLSIPLLTILLGFVCIGTGMVLTRIYKKQSF